MLLIALARRRRHAATPRVRAPQLFFPGDPSTEVPDEPQLVERPFSPLCAFLLGAVACTNPRIARSASTLLEIAPAAQPQALALRFTYDDGPGKIVRSNDLFSLDASGSTLRWGDESQAREQRQLFAVLQGTATLTTSLARVVSTRGSHAGNGPAAGRGVQARPWRRA